MDRCSSLVMQSHRLRAEAIETERRKIFHHDRSTQGSARKVISAANRTTDAPNRRTELHPDAERAAGRELEMLSVVAATDERLHELERLLIRHGLGRVLHRPGGN